MLTKIQNYLCGRNCYKIAVVILCLNFMFELVFQYCFKTQIEVFYFFIGVIICAVMIKNVIGKNNNKYLSVFYYFWPAVILIISCVSLYRFSLFPFVISSFVLLFLGKFKKKFIKIIFIFFNSIVLIMYLLIGSLFLFFSPVKEIVETIYSSDHKYVMILEESDVGATGGNVNIYVGRNIDFGILGWYMPRKIKYWGVWGERPEFFFVDDRSISINGEIIEIKGNKCIDNYYNRSHD